MPASSSSSSPPRHRRRSWRRRIVVALLVLTTTNLVVLAAQRTIATAFRVPSASMAPALEPGDRILTRDVAIDDLERGDVIVFEVPGDDSTAPRRAVKRVIALPGESIEANGGVIAIDFDTRLREPWLSEGGEDDELRIGRTELEQDEVYVLGDQRARSVDSRTYGPVDADDLVGRVVVRIWPALRIGRVS